MVTVVGRIYLDLKRKSPVRVTGDRVEKFNTRHSSGWLWPAEDLLSGETRNYRRSWLSEAPLNEMEVLAWVSL